eukprot:gnl/Hemi2/21924_TR7327_c0_g1_i1.p1 gnl/Hemi2/21924_TR7327_c0_g1~~gnl/Hemi2/21924_TR7327_c0_g1_i1.p1  ORF type:complete len:596 (-),score=135.63 gnl/Hemi2/21924_TR7327_c0_g1_i1:90-1877(-)
MKLNKDEIVALVLDYLRSNNYIKAMRSLEEESGLCVESLSMELAYFRGLLLDGQWEDVECFLRPLTSQPSMDFHKVLQHVRRQRFLEMLASPIAPAPEDTMNRLKELEGLVSREEYNTLCHLVNFTRITDHPEYATWTPYKGRLLCFDTVRPLFEGMFSASSTAPLAPSAPKIPPFANGRLSHLLRQSVMYQMSVYKAKVPEWEPPEKLSPSLLAEFDGQAPVEKAPSSGRHSLAASKTPSNNSLPRPSQQQFPSKSFASNDVSTANDAASTGKAPRYGDISRTWICAAMVYDQQTIRSAAFNNAGTQFAVGTNSSTVRVYSADPILHHSKAVELPVVWQRPRQHEGSVYCVAWRPDDAFVATGSNDMTVRLTSALTDHASLGDVVLRGHTGTVRDVSFLPDTPLLASAGGGDNAVLVWDLQTCQVSQRLAAHTQAVYSVHVMAGCNTIVTGSEDQSIRMWDLRTPHPVWSLRPIPHAVRSVSVDPQGAYLSAGYADGSVLLWDIARGSVYRQLIQHVGPGDCEARSVTFSPDGRVLATASFDTTVSLVDVHDFTRAHSVLPDHKDKVIQVRFNPAYPMVLSCSADRSARLWVAK